MKRGERKNIHGNCEKQNIIVAWKSEKKKEKAASLEREKLELLSHAHDLLLEWSVLTQKTVSEIVELNVECKGF